MTISANAIRKKLNGEPITLTTNAKYVKHSAQLFRLLVRQAIVPEPITYKAVAEELGLRHHRTVRHVLRPIVDGLRALSKSTGERIPPLPAIVINQNTGIPGAGFFNAFRKDLQRWLPKKIEDLERSEQRTVMKLLYSNELAPYPWDAVLKRFELTMPSDDAGVKRLLERAKNEKHHPTKGESDAHKSLKEYVSRNPWLVGLPNKTATGIIERCLPSRDRIDVFFENDLNWLAVEVKPAAADQVELVRGIFQCKKYLALMQAEQAAGFRTGRCGVVLVCGGKMSIEARRIANTLRVRVKEGIVPDTVCRPTAGESQRLRRMS